MDHLWVEQETLAPKIGVVIPAYFSATPSDEMVRRLLWMTLSDGHHYSPPENVWVVVDGDARTARIVEEIREQLTLRQGAAFNVLPLAENQGKLGAIRRGIAALLAERPDIEYVIIRDGDGDHAAADIPALARAAGQLVAAYGHSRLIVIGARNSRHRPMGWIRGELETLLDGVTVDALAYHLARQGRALNLSHCRGDAVPDLSSGYKVYGRQAAVELFVEHEPQLACLEPAHYWRYGPETVTVIEGLLKGAVIAELRRLTWDGQPATSFGEFRHVSLYGDLLAWVYTRLEIPIEVAARLYDNRVPSMPLRTTTEGRDLLDAVRRHALERTRDYRGEGGAIPPPPPTVPFL
ncbi:MAG: glycosyltransferase [Anaerolineae bacterium]